MKLLLQITILCLFVSSSLTAQQTQNTTENTTETIQRKLPKTAKTNALAYVNDLPAHQAVRTRHTNHIAIKKAKRVVANPNGDKAKKQSHREVIAQRKRVASKY